MVLIGLAVLFLLGGLANNLGMLGEAWRGETGISETAVNLGIAMALGLYSWDTMGANAVHNYAGGIHFIIVIVVIAVYFFAFKLMYRVSKFGISFIRGKGAGAWAREDAMAFISAGFLIVLLTAVPVMMMESELSTGLMFWRALGGAIISGS